MKVRELIKKLNQQDPDSDVVCYMEEEDFLPKNSGFRIFNIEEIDDVEAEKTRGKDQIPSLKFGKSEVSEKHVIIQITSEF